MPRFNHPAFNSVKLVSNGPAAASQHNVNPFAPKRQNGEALRFRSWPGRRIGSFSAIAAGCGIAIQ